MAEDVLKVDYLAIDTFISKAVSHSQRGFPISNYFSSIICCNTRWRFAPIRKSIFEKFCHSEIKCYNKWDATESIMAYRWLGCSIIAQIQKNMWKIDGKSYTFYYPIWICRMCLSWYGEWCIPRIKYQKWHQKEERK